ncbi:hypothetical protein PHYSODRAFT_469259 [Phytophthora sojae]|uniref:Uncharacterized protein n=1 Tax=Phytophthora sojae (strain P6497) TaxID=1094619 RepID=G4YQ28_PHYSP|nr:hypothetical protein PHYSODRAFT_469259 [Phytophthora sojae]EGZ29343.1 hypothetical protein PHYSODRAFT_469259 [Phytophthora sojae]|eukprot:XP_009516618.1 hypothetical protein PHYSODRAFT_469259 [Phytophthora sojae]
MTPCQRMKALLAAKALERKESAPVVSTVENLREFLQRKGELIPIVIRMKLVWITDHVYGTWKLVRLHFTDAEAPESLDNLLSVYKTPYEANREDIASALLTVTIWNVESDSELLPLPGSVVDINEYANLQLYRDKQCQLPTRLPQMIWSNEQSSPV